MKRLILLALLLVVPAAFAQSERASAAEAGSKGNVLLTFKIGQLDGGKKSTTKSYRLVVADGPIGSQLLAGQRVPFTMASGGDGGEIVYQNIGFSSEARAWIIGEGRIKIAANLEDSFIKDGSRPPVVETRQLTVNAILKDGVPLELTRIDGIGDVTGYVEVKAEIID